MTERRYTDQEIASIFERAAMGPASSPHQLAHPDGMTLAELQAIGREVGIAPEAVAHAAGTLEVRQGAVERRFLGLPVGVERRVTLQRRLTDQEWEHLVVQLRDVFQARGRIKTEGSLRQWTNGNLYVLLEPTPEGDRLRLGSVHGGAISAVRIGVVALGVTAIFALANIFGAHVASAGTIAGLMAGGSVVLASGLLRLRGWARLRASQMEDLATRLALPPGSTGAPGSDADR